MYRNGQAPGPDCVTTWPRSVVPSNAPRYTGHVHILLLQLCTRNSAHLFNTGSRPKDFLSLLSQIRGNGIWCIVNRNYFTKATIRFICLSIFCGFTSILCIYIFEQVDVLIWFQLDLVWDTYLDTCFIDKR